jgi:hypothetical protein
LYDGDLPVRKLVGGVLEIILSELMRAKKLVENIESKSGYLPLEGGGGRGERGRERERECTKKMHYQKYTMSYTFNKQTILVFFFLNLISSTIELKKHCVPHKYQARYGSNPDTLCPAPRVGGGGTSSRAERRELNLCMRIIEHNIIALATPQLNHIQTHHL